MYIFNTRTDENSEMFQVGNLWVSIIKINMTLLEHMIWLEVGPEVLAIAFFHIILYTNRRRSPQMNVDYLKRRVLVCARRDGVWADWKYSDWIEQASLPHHPSCSVGTLGVHYPHHIRDILISLCKVQSKRSKINLPIIRSFLITRLLRGTSQWRVSISFKCSRAPSRQFYSIK